MESAFRDMAFFIRRFGRFRGLFFTHGNGTYGTMRQRVTFGAASRTDWRRFWICPTRFILDVKLMLTSHATSFSDFLAWSTRRFDTHLRSFIHKGFGKVWKPD